MKKSPPNPSVTTMKSNLANSRHKAIHLLKTVQKRRLYIGLLFTGLFAIAAVIAISSLKAATPTVSLEVENGQLGGSAKSVANAGASGGNYVTFPNTNGGGTGAGAGAGTGGAATGGIQIPKTGTLLGIFSEANTPQSSGVENLEKDNIKRKFDMRMRFYSTEALMPQLGGIKGDIANSGRMEIVAWEPSSGWPSDQQVRDVANALKSDKPVQIRFAHEMNGFWYKWSQGSTDEYKANWKRVYGIVKGIAPNVLMNWAPFAYNFPQGKPYADYYPGDQFVDVVGIDLYVEQPGGTMNNTQSLFDEIYNKYSGKKPFMIMETNKGPRKPGAHFVNKADYYNDFVSFLQARPKISGVVFFDQNKWDGEGADMAIAKTPGPGDYNAGNMNAFVNMTKNCYWGTDAIQKACKGQ